MSRGVTLNLLASALTILATIVMLGAALVVNGAPVVAPVADRSAVAVYRFYDAVNEVIATGDHAALTHVVAPNFVGHAGSGTEQFDALELARRLVRIHAIASGLRLRVADITTAGDCAVVLLAQPNAATAAFLGVPFGNMPDLWGHLDAFRIENGRVAELWRGGTPVPVLDSLGITLLDSLPASDQVISFHRLSAAAGDAWTVDAPGQARVMYVDVGALTITVDPVCPALPVIRGRDGREREVRSGETATVSAGEVLTVAPDSRYVLGHALSRPALLAFEVDFPRVAYDGPLRPDQESASADGGQSTLQRESLGEARNVDLSAGAATLAFGRMTLTDGASLSLAIASGPIMLSVEAGTLEMALDLPNAMSTGSNDSRRRPQVSVLQRDQSTIVPDGVAFLYSRGNEPAAAFMVAISPGRPEQGTGGQSGCPCLSSPLSDGDRSSDTD